MAVVRSYYEGAQRNVGVPIASEFLGRFFAERKGMNDAALADEMRGEDPDQLAKMELQARTTLAKLQEELERSGRQDRNDESELARTTLQVAGRDRVANAQAAAKIADIRSQMLTSFWKQADKEAETIGQKAKYSAESAGKLDAIGTIQVGVEKARAAAEQVRALTVMERANPGDVRYDAMVRDAYNSFLKEGRKDMADAVLAELIPAAASEGLDANAWFLRVHSPLTFDEATRRAREEGNRLGAGADSKAVFDDLRRLGVKDPAALATNAGTSTRSMTTGAGRGSTPAPGGSIAISGSGPGPAAYTKAIQGGADPYAAMLAGIEFQVAYANDLKARREAASARTSNRFPRANPYLANPNSYVPDVWTEAPTRTPRPQSGMVNALGEDPMRDWHEQADDVHESLEREWPGYERPAPKEAPPPGKIPAQSLDGTRFEGTRSNAAPAKPKPPVKKKEPEFDFSEIDLFEAADAGGSK